MLLLVMFVAPILNSHYHCCSKRMLLVVDIPVCTKLAMLLSWRTSSVGIEHYWYLDCSIVRQSILYSVQYQQEVHSRELSLFRR